MTKNPQKARKNSSKNRSKKPTSVKLVRASSFLRHFRLVNHAHTGKIIHHSHSSHAVLLLLLALVGAFLFMSQQITHALNGAVTIGAIVNGPPPSVGAEITSPIDQAIITDQTIVVVSGTCAPSTFVVVKSNDILVGSTNCTVAGVFMLNVDLSLGENVLTALNYDNANQAGPVTSAVTITLRQLESEPENPVVSPEEPSAGGVAPTLPENPSIIPGLPGVSGDECDTYAPAKDIVGGGKPSISVVCIPRIIEKNKDYTFGVIVSGGTPPYALNINWGAGEDRLTIIPQSGYHKVKFRYVVAGAFNIKLNLTDRNGHIAKVETGVQVNGENRQFIATNGNIMPPTNWFESPIPLYLVAVAITLGFWAGDIFDRRFGAPQHRQARQKKA